MISKQIFILSTIVSLLLISSSAFALVTSMGKVQVISNYKDLQGSDFNHDGIPDGIWVVNWVVDQSGTDQLLGSSNGPIKATDTGEYSNADLNIQASSLKNWCEWSIQQDTSYTPVYHITAEQRYFYPWQGNDLKQYETTCKANEFYVFKSQCTPGLGGLCVYGWDAICARNQEIVGQIGKIYNEFDTYSIQFTVTSDSKSPQVSTISNTYDSSGGNSMSQDQKVGDNVWAHFNGYLTTGKKCTQPDYVYAMFTRGQWTVTDRNTYSTYTSQLGYGGGLISCIGYVFSSNHALSDCVNGFNGAADNAVATASNDPFVKQSPAFTGDINSGHIKIRQANYLSYPSFVLYIDTDYLALFKPAGTPYINSATSSQFNEGDRGQINVVVSNANTKYQGGFRLWATCQSPFTAEPGYQDISLGAGQQTSATLYIGGSTTNRDQSAVSGTCTVYFQERTTTQQVSKDVSVSMKLITQCTLNDQRCFGALIKRCDYPAKDWSQQTVIKDCSQENPPKNCTYDNNGKPICGGGNNDECAKDLDCDDGNKCTTDKCEPKDLLDRHLVCKHYNIPDCNITCIKENTSCGAFWITDPCCDDMKCKGGLQPIWPGTCTKVSPPWWNTYIPIIAGIAGAMVGFVFGYDIFKSKGKKKKRKTGLVVGLVLAIVFGIIFYLLAGYLLTAYSVGV